MKEYEQVKSFYKLKSEDDGQAAKDADKEIKQYNALYAAAVKNGYSVTDEQVQAYIEDMKLQLESVDNSEDIQDVSTSLIRRMITGIWIYRIPETAADPELCVSVKWWV